MLGFFAVYLLELSAERQIRRVKESYFYDLMKQEIGYFDVKDIGTLASDVETSCVQIRDGVGMKSGQIIRAVAQFFGGYAVALSRDWQMALLMTVAIPVIGVSFAVLIKSISQATESVNSRCFLATVILCVLT